MTRAASTQSKAEEFSTPTTRSQGEEYARIKRRSKKGVTKDEFK